MKEKLIIKNFGPIKSVELELGRFNVLIGENSTGKSTVAKVLATIYNLLMPTEGGGASEAINTLELSSLLNFKKKLAVYVIHRYLRNDSIIKLNRNLSGKNIFFHLEQEAISTNIDELLYSDYTSNNITYIPADRIATSLFTSATWPALIDVEGGRIDMPKYFLRFISLFERLKRARDEFDFTEILGVRFRQVNGIDEVILQDGNTISINESSSAIQANLSLCTVLDWQSEKFNTTKTFIIEEPELNLFPTTQNKLMEYLVNKTTNFGNNILLTTHSPYILTSLNNFIYAYKVGKINSEETEKVIDKKYWLNPDDVAAYMLVTHGSNMVNGVIHKDIFDREEGLIKAEKIDGITNILNEQFSSLLNLEFAANEFNT